MSVLSFLDGGLGKTVGGLFGGVKEVIGSVVTTDKDRLAAEAKLEQLRLSFLSDLTKASAEFSKSQAEVIKAEVNSQSWAARNWRAVVMLIFAFIVGWNFVLAPLFGLPVTEVPPDMYRLLEIGLGGYMVLEGAKQYRSHKRQQKLKK